MKMIANHGQSRQYYHDVVGCNSRLDSIQAAILNIKLQHLDEYAAARRKAADYYDRAFATNPKITTPFRAPYSDHVFHQYTLQLEGVDRNALKEFLAGHQVPAMIYYPVPGHKQKMFEQFKFSNVHSFVIQYITQICQLSCIFLFLPLLYEETLDQKLAVCRNAAGTFPGHRVSGCVVFTATVGTPVGTM